MILLTLSTEVTFHESPLTWKRIQVVDGITALVVCSNGHHGTITQHSIAEDGTVTPSVVCATDECDFHEYIQLVGWVSG